MDNKWLTFDKQTISDKLLTSYKVKSKVIGYVIETGKIENTENAAWLIWIKINKLAKYQRRFITQI